MKQNQSKMNSLEYTELKTQSYLKSDKMNSEEVKSAFKYRVRMARVKRNFPGSHSDLNCPLLCGSEDTQEHLLKCDKIKENCNKINDNITVKYVDVFSSCEEKIKDAVKLLDMAMLTREKILETNATNESQQVPIH